jgi:hypothetical protein
MGSEIFAFGVPGELSSLRSALTAFLVGWDSCSLATGLQAPWSMAIQSHFSNPLLAGDLPKIFARDEPYVVDNLL